jgi:hypothetical protein
MDIKTSSGVVVKAFWCNTHQRCLTTKKLIAVELPVVEVKHTEMADGSYWSNRQFTTRSELQELIEALQQAILILPEGS